MLFNKLKSIVFLALCILTFTNAFAQVPKLGTDSTLDIACWNINWFGDTQNGPTNEVLQFNNVTNVLKSTDFDIIALEEVSEPNAWANLLQKLPDYSSTITTFTQTQKTALLVKSSLFTILESKSILTEVQYSYNFASRPPLMITLSYNKNPLDTLICIVIHMKAQSESDMAGKQLSYNRRKGAGDALRTYIESNLIGRKFMIIGDWNDDLYTSIFNNQVSPYKAYMDRPYFFATQLLTDNGKHSTNNGQAMIDHQLVSDSMRVFYYDSSVQVFDNIKNYISSYSTTTSDHFPVFSRYRFFELPKTVGDTGHKDTSSTFINDLSENKFTIYPNPCKDKLFIHSYNSSNKCSVSIFDSYARLCKSSIIENHEYIDVSDLKAGLYFLRINDHANFHYYRVEILAP